MQRIRTKGRLLYESTRFGITPKKHARNLVISLPLDDIDLYYQWFVKKNHGITLQRPMFGPHVTVVGGNEEIKNMSTWKKYEGQIIELEYSPVVINYWQFWGLPVYGDNIQAIRSELGLQHERNLHITIGRQFEWQPIPKKACKPSWVIRREMEALYS